MHAPAQSAIFTQAYMFLRENPDVYKPAHHSNIPRSNT